jgi:polar amino acid transport system substrate-binding protein
VNKYFNERWQRVSMIWRTLVLSVIMTSLPAVAWATGVPCGPFHVAYYEYGAFYFQNAAGAYVGIDPDVLDELSRRTGCRFEGFLDSRVRTWQSMANGTLDMTVSVSTRRRGRPLPSLCCT